MIRALLFDLDQTLFDRTQSLFHFAQQQYRRFHPHISHVAADHFCDRLVTLDANGAVWKDRVYQQLIDEFEIAGVGWEVLLDDYVTRFAHSCVGFPHLHETLYALVTRGYMLGVVTNGRSPFQERNIEALGIAHYFDAVLVSATEGVRKPESEIFMRAAQRLDVRTEDIIFVGDNPQADIAGAQRCGMKTIWFSPRAIEVCTFADRECKGLNEILDLAESFDLAESVV